MEPDCLVPILALPLSGIGKQAFFLAQIIELPKILETQFLHL
jgi:hypothetical protein